MCARLRTHRGVRHRLGSNERSAAERINGALKDDFGARYVRVREIRKMADKQLDQLQLKLASS
jgi:hypothetical protein